MYNTDNQVFYTPPQVKIHQVSFTGVLCQSNGAKYNPTQEVSGITWLDDDES